MSSSQPSHLAPICFRLLTWSVSFALAISTGNAQQIPPTASGAELIQRIEALEREVADLRAELETKGQSSGVAEPPHAPPGTDEASQAGTSPAAPLSSILNGSRLSGSIDSYYSYNANRPASRSSNFRSFDGNSNQFALNLLKLALDRSPEPDSRTGYRVSLGFGQAINAVNASDPGGLGFDQYLEEAYFSYLAPAGKGLQIDVGKFVTPHGAEVIETRGNWNYSRGLLFSYAIPYFHYGARARYSFNEKYSLSGFLVNGWNNVVDNNSAKTVGVSVAWSPDHAVSLTQNYMAGPEQSDNSSNWRQLSDTVLSYALTRQLSLMANFDYGRGDRMPGTADPVFWTGAAGYLRYAFSQGYAVAVRYEHYDDHDGFTTGTRQHLNECTSTFERALGTHLLGRIEFRHDHSDRPTMTRDTGTATRHQNTVTAGMVFSFDAGEGR